MVSIPADALDPVVSQAGRAVGLLTGSDGSDFQINMDWFGDPPSEMKEAFGGEGQQALIELLTTVLGSSQAQVVGLPGPARDDSWIPIRDGQNNPTGVYVTVRRSGGRLYFGLGARFSQQAAPLTITALAHLPLLSVAGDNVAFEMGQPGAPIEAAFEVRHTTRFGSDDLGFDGVKLAGRVFFESDPEFSFVFTSLTLPGVPAADRSLADLGNIAPAEWIEMALAIFTAQVGTGGGTGAIFRHLLPVLGLSGDLPLIRWDQIADRGGAALRDWLAALVSDADALRDYLAHLKGLFAGDSGNTLPSVEGSGTRADPWRAGFSAGGIDLAITLAKAAANGDTFKLYPGVQIAAPAQTIGSARLSLEAALELVEISAGAAVSVRPLPGVQARLRLYDPDAGQPLVSHNFTGDATFGALGQFSIGQFRAGLKLDDQQRPVPMIELAEVRCARGSWPVIDLTSADAAFDAISAIANSVIQEKLREALGVDSGDDHPGKHIGALLGLIRPTTLPGGAIWPTLVSDASHLDDLISDPLRAVACYHAKALDEEVGGSSGWRFLLHDLWALVHHPSTAAPALSGDGTESDPWLVTLLSDSTTSARLFAFQSALDDGRAALTIGLLLSPTPINLGGGARLGFDARLEVLTIRLPDAATCAGAIGADWLPALGARGMIFDLENDPITTPALAGLAFSVGTVSLAAEWIRAAGLGWFARATQLSASWGVDAVTVPELNFGTHAPLAWDFSLPDLGAGLEDEVVASIGDWLRVVAGRFVLERGGRFGFGLAGLLGLLPDLPNLSLPGLEDLADGPFALPGDWPQFAPANWPAFFVDPWPDIRAHVGGLLTNPAWAIPTLRWIGGALHGALPDLSLPGSGLPGSEFPALPFEITGVGAYDDPWAIALNRPGARGVQLLLWLDPDGPPSGGLIDAALRLLPAGLRDLDDLTGDTISDGELIALLEAIGTVDGGINRALNGFGGDALADGLEALDIFLNNSDGVLLTIGQQADGGGWDTLDDLPEAHHAGQLAHPAVVDAIAARINAWSASAPVLLIGAAWERAADGLWSDLLAEFGSPAAPHFDLREPNVNPDIITVSSVIDGSARFYTADIAVFHGLTPIPVDAPGDSLSQRKQISRIVDRIRELHGGAPVILVAHSTLGLAAHAAIARDGGNTRITGLITVGTPHLDTANPLGWLGDTRLLNIVNLFDRLDPDFLPAGPLRDGFSALVALAQGEVTSDYGTPPVTFPSTVFTYAGPTDLPEAVRGYAIATRLPGGRLRDHVLDWLRDRIADLRALFETRSEVTHLGVGLRVLPPTVAAAAIEARLTTRLDILRFPLTDDPPQPAPALPRLSALVEIERPDGWLVGGVGQNPRLRRAELGATIAPRSSGGIEVIPIVRLHDTYVDGASLPLAGLTGPNSAFRPDSTVNRLLEELLRVTTREAPGSLLVSELGDWLEPLGLAEAVGAGYGISLDGWNSLLADPAAYLRAQFTELLADTRKRGEFFDDLIALFGIDPDGWISALLMERAGDPAPLRALRAVLAELGLLDAARGGMINPAAWLDLLRAPVGTLNARVQALFDEMPRREALIVRLRTLLALDDADRREFRETYGLVTLRFTSAGVAEICINAPLAGGELTLSTCARLDLAARSLSVEARVRPAAIGLALAAVYSTLAEDPFRIQLNFGGATGPAPYPALDLFPLASDFGARIGEIAPRFALSAFTAALIETRLIPARTDAGPLLEALGLAYRRANTAPWRLRPLDGLFLNPAEWLLSPAALGTNDGQISPARVLLAANQLAGMIERSAGNGVIDLGFRFRLVATASGNTAHLRIETEPPINVNGGSTIDLAFTMAISPGVPVRVGGQIETSFAMPDAIDDVWPQIVIRAGYDGSAFSLAIGDGSLMIRLVPFSGWDQALLGGGAGGGLGDDVPFSAQAADGGGLLGTMTRAAIQAMRQAGGADLAAFADRLVAAANALAITSLSGLNALTSNPVGWLQGRFSAANAEATATALMTLLTGVLNLTRSGGLLTLAPAAQVTIRAGRDTARSQTPIGVAVIVDGLITGPMSSGLDAYVGISDAPNPPVRVELELETGVAPGQISPGGVNITPSLSFRAVPTSSSYELRLWPIGNDPDTPDFVLNLLPTFSFACESGDAADCLLSLTRRVLVPAVVEVFLDNAEVTAWLKTDLITGSASLIPGDVLIQAGVLVADGDGYNLASLSGPGSIFASGEVFASRLIGAGLKAAFDALGTTPIIPITTTDRSGGIQNGGLYLANDGTRYGLRLNMPDLILSRDPEVIVELAGETEWIERAGGPALEARNAGITLYLVSIPADITGITFDVSLHLISIGLEVTGKDDDPLIDVSGWRLGGFRALLFLQLDNLISSPAVTWGVYGQVKDLGVPLGAAAGGNSIVQGLLSSESGTGGENTPVNPGFSLAIAWAGALFVDLGGSTEIWFPIQGSFGPIYIEQIGLGFNATARAISLLLDGGVRLGGLNVGLDDLSITVPLMTIGDLSTWQLGLKGLAIAYDGGGVRITGGLLETRDPDGTVRYDGICLVEVAGMTFTALGSYAEIRLPEGGSVTSVFIFVVLPITLGGPPYFFVLGLAGGFGYNRGLVIPDAGEIPDFPLIAAAKGENIASDPMAALRSLGVYVPPKRGSYWIAGGLKFTSFTIVNSVALIYVLLDSGVEIGLLGLSQVSYPPGAPLVNIEMALKARFSTREGVFGMEARLTDNSYLLYRDCRLTGGFAFYVWFSGPNAGDFVITMGGYHPAFRKPDHFPDVPRLGFHWRITSDIHIKGELYFALTTSAIMAGGMLEAAYMTSNLKAWFRVWADFLISWKPFYYDIRVGISIGIQITVDIDLFLFSIKGTFKLEIGAELHIWGPEFSGTATFHVWVLDITIPFGANSTTDSDRALPWSEFRSQLLPAELLTAAVETGLLEDKAKTQGGSDAERANTGPWQMKPEFVLTTRTAIASNSIRVNGGPSLLDIVSRSGLREVDIRPMKLAGIVSHHQIRILRADGSPVPLTRNDTGIDRRKALFYQTNGGPQGIRFEYILGQVPAALWDYIDADEDPDNRKIEAITGVRIVVQISDQALRDSATGEIPVNLFEVSSLEHPLPFENEIGLRFDLAALASIADLLAANNIRNSSVILQATQTILAGAAWQGRRDKTLEELEKLGANLRGVAAPQLTSAYLPDRRSAPPRIATLYEGMAAETVVDVPLVDREIVAPPVPVVYERLPHLMGVIRQRPEIIRAAAPAIRTTIAQVMQDAQLPRVAIAASRKVDLAGAALRRVEHPAAPRPTQIASAGVSMANDRFVSADLRQQFEAVQAAALVRTGGGGLTLNRISDGPVLRAQASVDLGGVPIQAGTTQVWELPARSAVGAMPVLAYSGDQGLRITVLDKASALIADVEVIGQGQYALPENTARIALTGLGVPSALTQPATFTRVRDLPAGMGAITLRQATHPVPVVGWMGGSQLVQITRSALLGRGAVIRTASRQITYRDSHRIDQAVITGQDMMTGQDGVETWLPPGITTLGIVVEHLGTSGQEDLSRTIGLSVIGATVSEPPILVAGSARGLLLYDVLNVDEGAAAITVALASRIDWRISGVIGMTGAASNWARTLAAQSVDTLVENGPLTPTGITRVRFVIEDPAEQPEEPVLN